MGKNTIFPRDTTGNLKRVSLSISYTTSYRFIISYFSEIKNQIEISENAKFNIEKSEI